MEAEGLHLPDEVLQLPVGEPEGARFDQRALDRQQVVQQLNRGVVGEQTLLAAGGADPVGHVEQVFAVLLLGSARLDLGETLGVGLPRRGEARAQVLARGGRDRVGRQRPADPGGRGLEPEQDVLRLDPHRLGGDLGGDGRVAVAVASHPAAEAKVGGRQRRPAARVARAQGGVELAVELRHDPEERVVEDRHDRADLVQSLDLGAAQLRRAPERVDLLQEPAAGVPLLAAGRPRIVQPIELDADPGDGGYHRPAPGLGRVGGQHWVHAQLGQQPPEPFLAEAVADLRHRRGERLGQLGTRPVALAQGPGPVPLLGQVGEVEVAGEGARDPLGLVEAPARDQLLCRALLLVAHAGRDHGAAKLLDILQQLHAALLGEHLAEQVAEQPHLLAEGLRHLLPR